MMPEGYMSTELLLQVDALAREKNVHKDVVFGALEMAIASATKKRFTEDVDVRVAIDRNTGEFESFRRWQVVADDAVENAPQQIARHRGAQAVPGHPAREISSRSRSSRSISAASARRPPSRSSCSSIRDAEREQLLNDFLGARREAHQRRDQARRARQRDHRGRAASRRCCRATR